MAGYALLKPLGYLTSIFSLLRKHGLIHVIVFLVLFVPGIVGNYHYLASQVGVPVYISVPGAIGIEFGGALIDLLNTLDLFLSATLVEKVALVFSSLWSIHKLLYFYFIYWWISTTFNTDNQADYFIILSATALLGLLSVLVIIVDWYVVPFYAGAETIRPPGVAYAFTNFGEVVVPFYEATWDSATQLAPDIGTGENVNQTINNTSGNQSTAVNTTSG